ncbi:endolytic transglycosylase MltG, partial [Candidatus Parcubacteria bacterium]
WWGKPAKNAETINVIIEQGDSLAAVADKLKNSKIIKRKGLFKVYSWQSGSAAKIKPGSFDLYPGDNFKNIISIITIAPHNDVAITVPEGYTLAQIGELVAENFDITMEEWNKAVGQFSPLEDHPFVIKAQKPDNVDLEGYLFPDTYRFYPDANAEEIAQKMLDEMAEKFDDSSVPDGWTIHSVLTLASIVEKEVRTPEDMAMVADIFIKRLEIGMALQSDATVNYITGGNSAAVSGADLDIDSLYNTYKYSGLPPGPISNPGLAAINAVLHPKSNDYYYFLTTKAGDVIYAKTFDEHIANKAKYLY